MPAHEPIDPRAVSRSRSGPTTRRAARSQPSAPSTVSPASRSTSCADVPPRTGRRRCWSRIAAAAVEPVEAERPGQRPSTQVRAALEASGLDHGPISVHDKMAAMGLGVEAITGKRVQANHPRQERTLPPDPVSLPRQAATRRHTGRAPSSSSGRRVRPHLQHRTPPPRTPRDASPPSRPGRPPRRPRLSPQTREALLRSSGRETLPARAAADGLPAGTTIRKLEQCRHLLPGKRHLLGRRTARLPTGPGHRRRRHHHRRRLRRRDPHRAHPSRTRDHLRRQRQTPRPTTLRIVTEVLTHQLSPKS